MRRMLVSGLALLATTISIDAAAQEASQATYYSRPGSTVPFSPAVRAGDLIFISGQIGIGADAKVPATMTESAKAAMENIRTALTTAGATFDDVVKCTVFIVDMTQWGEFNKVYATYFKPGRLPARSALGATALAFNATVEVECIAYKPLGQSK